MDEVLVRERDDSSVSIGLSGDLDELSCGDIESTILTASKLWRRVVVDLGAVTFCTSAGLSMFVRCHNVATEQGGTFVLTNAPSIVHRVIEVTGLTHLLAATAPEPVDC
jgi:anti-anti-sigma factor